MYLFCHDCKFKPSPNNFSHLHSPSKKMNIKLIDDFFMALQISCQFLDYDSAEEVGLAEGFQPSVKVSCVGGTMKIRVDTKKPFQGIIHGPNRTEPGCSKLGNSGLKTYLNIDLTRPEGSVVSIFLLAF